MKKLSHDHHLLTRCVHGGAAPDPSTGAVMQPVYLTSTYVQEAPGQYRAYEYSRSGNPSRDAVEAALATLEGAEHGLAWSSGLAATQALVQGLEPGDHVLVCDDVYGGTGRLFRTMFARYGITFEFLDMTDLAAVQAALRPNTKMLWMESPSNPLLKVMDITALAEIARGHGATLVVDNTFASPIFQSPLALGAHVVLHSTTKYLGGHSDMIGGALMTSDRALYDRLKYVQFATGPIPSPFECFLLHRSIKTLALRMAQHEKNALLVADALQSHPQVERVLYPGLPSHPQHALASRQMSGYSGIVSFYLKGDFEAVERFFRRLEVFVLAESLGGVESLANHPERMTHASVPPELRAKLGINHALIRLSCGIEHGPDLVDDLRQALA